MNLAHRQSWNDRHRGQPPGEPEPCLREMISLLPHGLALDVACGTGRNSIPLARNGIHVVAADFSEIAIRGLASFARNERLPIFPVVADLEDSFPFRPASFDLVINISYLDRALVPDLINSLRPGGILLFDTFTADQAAIGHPNDPRFLLKRYELRDLVATMELIRYREGLTIYPNGRVAWRATALARRMS